MGLGEAVPARTSRPDPVQEPEQDEDVVVIPRTLAIEWVLARHRRRALAAGNLGKTDERRTFGPQGGGDYDRLRPVETRPGGAFKQSALPRSDPR